MNALGWSRQRAMEYMRANTMLSDTEIATETLRYAVDIPAQALAYKIGSLKMIELRAARSTLLSIGRGPYQYNVQVALAR